MSGDQNDLTGRMLAREAIFVEWVSARMWYAARSLEVKFMGLIFDQTRELSVKDISSEIKKQSAQNAPQTAPESTTQPVVKPNLTALILVGVLIALSAVMAGVLFFKFFPAGK
jgi:hypothetical protein